jgi:photosystem II stability/assembly factor-like uncharacterized protein
MTMIQRIIKQTLPFPLLLLLIIQPVSFGNALALVDANATDPAKYAQEWRPTGPPGGDVRDLVVDPNNPDRFYFGTLDGQIYTSGDGGRHWELLHNFNRPRIFIDHILVDPRNSKTLYVAAHRHKEPGGFFKSTDGGKSWRESVELKKESLHSLIQADADPNVLYAGTITGIFRSDDSGESWTRLPTQDTSGLVNVESLATDPRTANTIYAGTWYLPYKSTDGGQTWRSIKNGIIDDSDIFAINIDPRNPNHVIMSACSGIYETKNAGDSWRKVQGIPSQSRRTRAILQHPSVPGLVFAGTTEGFWRSERGGDADSWMVTTSRQLEINSITVHPSRPETVYIGTNNYGVMVSHDSGKTFLPTNGGYSGRFANTIVADIDTPNRIYAATINTATGGGFLFVSNDNGESWKPSMRNMPARLITYAILQDQKDPNVIYLGTNLGVYRSMDRGGSWSPIWSSPESEADATLKPKRKGSRGKKTVTRTKSSSKVPRGVNETVRKAQEVLTAGGYRLGEIDGRLGTQTIAGLRRFQSDRHLPVTGRLDDITLAAMGISNSPNVEGVESTDTLMILTDAVTTLVHATDHETGDRIFLAGTNVGLYRSSDPAKGWKRLPYGTGLDPRTSCISTVPSLPGTIWVGTADSGVLVSHDGGATWKQDPAIPTDIPVNTIAQDPQRPKYVYVGTKQAFFASHDGGKSWSRRGGNLPFGDFTSILINPRNGDEIFVGNAFQNGEIGGGVYRTLDAGMTWGRIDPKEHRLPSQRIWSLAFDAHDQNTLFVGSHSAGVYVVPRSSEALSASSQ